MLSSKDKARMSAIIAELTALSREGWKHARAEDYAPLEAELESLLERARNPYGLKHLTSSARRPIFRASGNGVQEEL